MSEDVALPYEPPPAGDLGRSRTWGLGDAWTTLGLYVVFGLTAAGLISVLPDNPEADAWGIVLLLTVPWIGLAGWPLFATRTKGRGPVVELRLRGSAQQVGLGVVAGFAGLVLAGLVAALTQLVMGQPLVSSVGELADTMADASPWPLVVLALLAGFGAPVVEELAFRGLLYGALEKRGQAKAACVVISAVAFAMFHFEPARFPVLLVIGLTLSAVRAVTGSTRASIAAHMANNFPASISLLVLAFS